jgi:hypothetical protein
MIDLSVSLYDVFASRPIMLESHLPILSQVTRLTIPSTIPKCFFRGEKI